MQLKPIFATSLVILQFILMSVSLADDSELEHAEFWPKLNAIVQQHNVSYKRFENNELYEVGQFLRQGDLFVSLAEGKSAVTARIANSQYAATLLQREREKKKWSLRWISRRDSSVAPLDQRFENLFLTQVCDPAGVATALSNPQLRSKLTALSGGYEFVLSRDLPNDCGIHPAYAGARYRVFGPPGRYPKRIETLMANQSAGTRADFQVFESVDGIEIPKVVSLVNIKSFGSAGLAPARYEYDLKLLNEPFNSEMAYLPYYGLPEPDSEKRFPFRLLLVIAVGIALPLLVLFFGKYYARSASGV